MPIYEYRCTSCGCCDSGLEKVGAARVKKCPGCGRRTFSRLISAAAFHLKGGGWYATDFKDKGKPDKDNKADKADKADKANTAAADKKPDDKSGADNNKSKSADKKPAAKKDGANKSAK